MIDNGATKLWYLTSDLFWIMYDRFHDGYSTDFYLLPEARIFVMVHFQDY